MLNSRQLLNLILILVLLVLGYFIFFSKTKDDAIKTISALKAADVSTIAIQYQDQRTVITLNNNLWNITTPAAIEADEFRIKAVLNLLSETSDKQYSIDASALPRFGLQPAKATLTLNQQEFLFGDTSSIDNRRYVYTNNTLFLIDDNYYPLIISGYKNLMRRQLLPSNTPLQKITIGKQYEISRNQKSGWTIDKSEIGADTLKQFVDNWLHIQAYSVSSMHKAATGTKVSIQSSNKRYEFIVEKTEHNTVVHNPELQLSYQFDASTYKSLLQPDYYKKAEQPVAE